MSKHVLVVDDELYIREIVSEGLTYKGYNVSLANNGLEALHAMTKADFDVVLMDSKMPVMDGVTAIDFLRKCEQGEHHLLEQHPELAESLHSRIKGSRIPVVACSAMMDDFAPFQETGVDEHVEKPFRLIALFDVIAQHAGASKDVDEIE